MRSDYHRPDPDQLLGHIQREEAHGGRIWARNRNGGGSVVSVALPVYP